MSEKYAINANPEGAGLREYTYDPKDAYGESLRCPAAGGIFQPQGWQGGLPRERHMLREAYSGNTHVGVAQRRNHAHGGT